MMSLEIHVYGDWEELGSPRRIGLLKAIQTQGQEVFSFEYDPDWLKSNDVFLLDPDLQLYQGPQYVNEDRPNFGLFLDSSPDRWGRVLMQRKEAIDARKGERKARNLRDSDLLLGVHDEQRMGGLRFKEELDGPFLSVGDGMPAPPWARLRELENAAWKIQASDSKDDDGIREWLALLINPGSSIGGARPKAGICDEEGNLWIAKFPERNDEWDIGAWEMVVHHLAVDAGLTVAEAKADNYGRPHATFMTKRFDRRLVDGERKRLHFASAMTMLGYTDGTNYADGACYLEIAEFISCNGSNVEADLAELWRRIVFSICVCNTDDHLRNHGFILGPSGWRLSPAYDLNASPQGKGLSLAISDTDNSLSLDLALSVREFFRVSKDDARDIINRISESVHGWGHYANNYGIPRDEQDRVSPAFAAADLY
jgi:serine/threonine-protein kinase HipA